MFGEDAALCRPLNRAPDRVCEARRTLEFSQTHIYCLIFNEIQIRRVEFQSPVFSIKQGYASGIDL